MLCSFFIWLQLLATSLPYTAKATVTNVVRLAQVPDFAASSSYVPLPNCGPSAVQLAVMVGNLSFEPKQAKLSTEGMAALEKMCSIMRANPSCNYGLRMNYCTTKDYQLWQARLKIFKKLVQERGIDQERLWYTEEKMAYNADLLFIVEAKRY
ncbi:MAG: hypothetical protein RL660_960 [Bacteroidota bacterium]|jgi:hypothetical protein